MSAPSQRSQGTPGTIDCRVEPHRLGEVASGFVEPSCASQREAQIVVRRREVGGEPHGFGEVGYGIERPVVRGEGEPEIGLNVRVAGFQSKGLSVLSDGVVEATLRDQHLSQAVADLYQGGVHTQRRLERGDRRKPLPLLGKGFTETRLRGCKVRFQSDCPSVMHYRLIQSPQPGQRRANVVVPLCGCGVELE